jgi:IS5 family transposase
MIRMRHHQPSLWESFFAEEVADLWEPWMRVVDELLEDEELLSSVYDAQGKRHPQSRTRGRNQTPAEVVLRMLILKHVRNWSYETLEREVRANVVYRNFCRIGTEKVPDAKTLVRLGQAVGAETIGELHDRLVTIAQERKVVQGRKMRVDTTVVEVNIHYPTDSGLLNDGARVLTRTMKKIEQKAGGLKRKIRDRKRSVAKRVIAIGHALRHKGPAGEEKRKREYRELLQVTRRIVGDARRVLEEVDGLTRRRRSQVQGLCEDLRAMAHRVAGVMRQTKARIFAGLTKQPDKIVSLFEPHTEIIRKGKAGKPNEFGKLVQIQEAENQIITHYEVYDNRPADQRLLIPAVQTHQRKLGRVPRLVAADAGYYSRANEEAAHDMGVKWLSVPNRATRSEERRKLQKRSWFKNGQRWRTGCEGRISTVKRRHGLARCRYRGMDGMQRWVGLGVIADNLINIGKHLIGKHLAPTLA